MARAVFVSATGDASRAKQLGLGLVVKPVETPFAYLEGEGLAFKMDEPIDQSKLAANLQQILDAEAAAATTAATLQANQQTITDRASQALSTNAAALALPDPTAANQTYLAIGSPTTAQAVAQVAALTRQVDALVSQVQALTNQNSALIRLALSQFDSTSGT